ncbi:putative cyclin-D6-1 [Wolffia australiana]
MEFDLEFPLAGDASDVWRNREEALCHGDWLDSVESLFAAESDHVSSLKNPDEVSQIRRDAVSLLVQAQEAFSLDPLLVFLATNYIDRFLSRETISRDKSWIVGLLSVSCFSLACKMNKMEFSAPNFQPSDGLAFDSQTIRRMEVFVLRALDWRMRSITPFSFLRFFLAMFPAEEPPLLAVLKARASEIIILAQTDSKLLNRKPSVAAASALLSASRSLLPRHFPSFRDAIGSCAYVQKEDLWSCCAEFEGDRCSTPLAVLRLHRHSSSSESESGDLAGSAEGQRQLP